MGNGKFGSRPGQTGTGGSASGGIHATGHGTGVGGGKPVGHAGGYSGTGKGGSMKKPGGSKPSGGSSGGKRAGSGERGVGLGTIGNLLGGLLGSSGQSSSSSSSGGGLLGSLGGMLLGGVSTNTSSSSSSSGNSGGSVRSNSGCLKKILIYALIFILIIFILKSCGVFDTLGTISDTSSLFSTNSFYDILSASSDSASYDGSIEAVEVTDDSQEEYIDTIEPSEGVEENNFISASTGITGGRTKRTQIIGGGKDVFTIMVYMCGTDLESKYGMATADLKEMIAASSNPNLNIIVETGGASKWQNSTVDASKIQRFKVTSGGIKKLETLNDMSMTNPSNLSSFIKYCAKNYKANRYGLILWDHGGGSISGYGYDETERANDSMTIDEINSALEAGGVAFDFVGFDACLMATAETAYMLNYHSDYMIASEETEPGIGWYYTNWLSKLAQNTSMPTTTIGKNIIDDFSAKCAATSGCDNTTLSLIDLVEFNNVADPAIRQFSASVSGSLDRSDYNAVAKARGAAKEFGDNSYDQVDLMDLANRVGSADAKKLVSALKTCIKYNKTSARITNANGLSVYFPYKQVRTMNSMLKMYDKINVCTEYRTMTKKFANLVLGGKIASSSSSGSSGSMFDASDLFSSFLGGGSSSSGGLDLGALSSLLGGRSMTLSDTDWIDADYINSQSAYFTEDKVLNDSRICLTKKKGLNFLSLTKAEWDLVDDVQQQVFIYDSDNDFFIDLGMDMPEYRYLTEEKLDLLADFTGSWLTINGQPFCVYLDSYEEFGNHWKYTYRIPAMLETDISSLEGKLTDEKLSIVGNERAQIPVYLYVIRDDTMGSEYDSYKLAYARPIYLDGEADTLTKTITLTDGDVIVPLCDCYDADYNFIDTYVLGEDGSGYSVTIGSDTKVERLSLSNNHNWLSRFCVTDVYGNTYWTDQVANFE